MAELSQKKTNRTTKKKKAEPVVEEQVLVEAPTNAEYEPTPDAVYKDTKKALFG